MNGTVFYFYQNFFMHLKYNLPLYFSSFFGESTKTSKCTWRRKWSKKASPPTTLSIMVWPFRNSIIIRKTWNPCPTVWNSPWTVWPVCQYSLYTFYYNNNLIFLSSFYHFWLFIWLLLKSNIVIVMMKSLYKATVIYFIVDSTLL